MATLLDVEIRTLRELIATRRKIRQICRMLALDVAQQLQITCVAFEMLCHYLDACFPIAFSVCWRADELHFEIQASKANQRQARQRRSQLPPKRLSIPCPFTDQALPPEDIRWVIETTDVNQRRMDLEELHQQNRDMLTLLLEIDRLKRKNHEDTSASQLEGAA